jgi:hypothetical protein
MAVVIEPDSCRGSHPTVRGIDSAMGDVSCTSKPAPIGYRHFTERTAQRVWPFDRALLCRYRRTDLSLYVMAWLDGWKLSERSRGFRSFSARSATKHGNCVPSVSITGPKSKQKGGSYQRSCHGRARLPFMKRYHSFAEEFRLADVCVIAEDWKLFERSGGFRNCSADSKTKP